MYIWNVLRSLILYLDQLGSPAKYIVPSCFLMAGVIQFLCFQKLSGKKRWIPAVVFVAITLLGEVSLWLIKSYTALLMIIVMHFSLTALLGALAAFVVYRFWIKIHHS